MIPTTVGTTSNSRRAMKWLLTLILSWRAYRPHRAVAAKCDAVVKPEQRVEYAREVMVSTNQTYGWSRTAISWISRYRRWRSLRSSADPARSKRLSMTGLRYPAMFENGTGAMLDDTYWRRTPISGSVPLQYDAIAVSKSRAVKTV